MDDVAELEVKDTGVGIPDSELPHIFERFYRLQSSEVRTQEGTGIRNLSSFYCFQLFSIVLLFYSVLSSGIGLSMVNELVKLHGGTISVHSELGKGTTFVVSIPYGYRHLPLSQVKHTPALLYAAVQHSKQVRLRLGKEKQSDTPSWWISAELSSLFPGTLDSDVGQQEKHGSLNEGNICRIVVADDNHDMRNYITHLLSGI